MAARNDLSRPGRLLELARQFGYGTGTGRALRTAAGMSGKAEVLEDRHDVGEAFVKGQDVAIRRIGEATTQAIHHGMRGLVCDDVV